MLPARRLTDPAQLQLHVLVLDIVVNGEDDARQLLEHVLARRLGEVDFLELDLGGLLALTNSGAEVVVRQPRRLHHPQRRAVLVPGGDEDGGAEGSHRPVHGVRVHEASQSLRQHPAGNRLAVELLIACRFIARSVHELPSVCEEPRHSNADVVVNGEKSTTGTINKHFGNNEFLEPENNSILASHTDSGSAGFDGLRGVLNLEYAPIW
mmetsp:Transcript_42195/g.84562  ORF Transcript_42195/g.84562 Transcript_42195/m.84562 type:complete len:209 (+) Transcript_42195:161-787(+)